MKPLKKRKCPFRLGPITVVKGSIHEEFVDVYIFSYKGELFLINAKYYFSDHSVTSIVNDVFYGDKVGIINSSKQHLYNADSEYGMDCDSPLLISFECVQELWGIGPAKIKIIDSFPEKIIDKKNIKNATEMKKYIKKGFTPIFKNDLHTWNNLSYIHQTGACLVTYKGQTALFAFDKDGDQYYGVLLRNNVKTIKEAYQDLIPDSMKNAKIAARQGEWFFVQDDKIEDGATSIHNVEVRINDQTTYNGSVILPRSSNESQEHKLCSSHICVSKDGKRFWATDPILEHPEHETINMKGQYRIEENTAIKSVSVHGVD